MDGHIKNISGKDYAKNGTKKRVKIGWGGEKYQIVEAAKKLNRLYLKATKKKSQKKIQY